MWGIWDYVRNMWPRIWWDQQTYHNVYTNSSKVTYSGQSCHLNLWIRFKWCQQLPLINTLRSGPWSPNPSVRGRPAENIQLSRVCCLRFALVLLFLFSFSVPGMCQDITERLTISVMRKKLKGYGNLSELFLWNLALKSCQRWMQHYRAHSEWSRGCSQKTETEWAEEASACPLSLFQCSTCHAKGGWD